MPAYAVAHIREMKVNSKIVAYLNRIDATLQPFDGRFLVHGRKAEVLEGAFPGHLIIIAFPDLEHARGWYYSDAYQEILSFRTNNSEGDVILADGVPEDYQASDLLSR